MDDVVQCKVREGFLGQKMIVIPGQIKEKMGSNEIIKPFRITDLGYYPNAKNHLRVRKKGAKEYIFFYCTKGEGWLDLNKTLTHVTPNHYFIIPKNTKHKYMADDENPWSIYWMHMDGFIAETLFKRYSLNSEKLVPIPFSEKRINQFNQIMSIFDNYNYDMELEYASILSKSFISSFIYNDIGKAINKENFENLVNSIKKYLNNHIEASVKIDEIAQTFNYSPSYICSIFKKSTGYSINHFFNLKKMQKACEYLNYTNLNVKEISYKMGYRDPFYFSRVFKKYIGVSPKTYRKNY